jgi:hypothetical protein
LTDSGYFTCPVQKKLRLAFGGKRESVLTFFFFFFSAFAGNKIAVGDLELLGNDFFNRFFLKVFASKEHKGYWACLEE